MNKRSKVLLIILIVIVVVTFISAFSNQENNNDEKLIEFEEEIVNPNNQLDPLNKNHDSNVLLIEVALKADNIIEKIFTVFVDMIKGLTDKII